MTPTPNTQIPSTTSSTLPWYRRETWLVVFLLACIPLVLTMVASPAWKIPFAAMTGVLVLIGLVMAIWQSRETPTT